jgi:hypothetical protein
LLIVVSAFALSAGLVSLLAEHALAKPGRVTVPIRTNSCGSYLSDLFFHILLRRHALLIVIPQKRFPKIDAK